MKTISFKLAAFALTGLIAMNAALAQNAPSTPTAPKTPEPDYTLSYNVGVVSDYRYRAISQTTLKPAVQGGVDFAHKNGLYVGAWASTVKWVKDVGVGASTDTGSTAVELDLYGGYKWEAAKDMTLDIGVMKYIWPGNKIAAVNGGTNADTFELYAAITSGIFTAKYSQSTTSLFGTATTAMNSKGSSYLEAAATFELAKGLTLVPHIGRQTVKNFGAASYTDYALTLNKDVDGVVYSVSAISTSAQQTPSYAYVTSNNKNTAKGGIVLSIKKNF